MKIGLDSFTIRELKLDPFRQLEYVNRKGYEGIQFHDIKDVSCGLDVGFLKELYRCAQSYGLYCHMSLGMDNFPLSGKNGKAKTVAALTREIEACAAVGWRELRAVLGGVDERFGAGADWAAHRRNCVEILKALVPVLRANRCRINLEDHGDMSTFELVEIVEEVGPEFVGINLDTANVLVFAEDPVMAAERVAPYTHLTHAKDGIIFFTENGVMRQGRPAGEGVVDWPAVLKVLAKYDRDIPISIEDHKWLFEMKIFEKQWHAAHCRVTPYELARFVKLAAGCSQRLAAGELPDVAEYEAIPYVEQMEERLAKARTHLQSAAGALSLA